jgi:uncharacterized membrane protein
MTIHMKQTVIGVFQDSKRAGEAISELKEMGYTKDISVLAKDVRHEGARTHQIKEDLPHEAAEGAATGSVLGGISGAVVGLLSGAATAAIGGVGIAVVGPLATTLIGAGAGGGTGALIGALVDMGIPEKRAKEYQHLVETGQVLVTVTVGASDVEKVEETITFHQDLEAVQNSTYTDYAVDHYRYAI